MVKGIRRPSMPFPGIVTRMDSIIKNYFDSYRNTDQFPPIIDGKINGKLAKNMPKTLYYKEGENIVLIGRPDDYLELADGSIVPLDHKTCGKIPEMIHPTYQLQLNMYSFLIKANKYTTRSIAYLVYYCPQSCMIHEGMNINAHVLEVATNPIVARRLLEQAKEVLSDSKPPSPKEECQFCRWMKTTYV